MKKLRNFCFGSVERLFALAVFCACVLTLMNISAYYFHIVRFRPLYYILSAALVALLVWLLVLLVKRWQALRKLLATQAPRVLLAGVLVLFCVQTTYLAIAYVPLGWDVNDIIGIASGAKMFDVCLTRYPNNILMTACFQILYQFTQRFGMDCWLSSMLLSAVAVDAAILFICGTVRRVFGLKPCYLTFLCSVLLFALHPTISVPYSDSMAMPFTTGFLYVFLRLLQAQTRKEQCRFAALAGAFLVLGYLIKPTVAIVGIAAAILLLLKIKKPTKAQVKSVALCILFAAAGAVGSYAVKIAVMPSVFLFVPTEEQQYATEFPMQHFFMMGLNEKDNYYGFFRSDVHATAAVSGKAEKAAFNNDVSKARLRRMGVAGFLEHCINKAVWVTTDGTFYYGGEGGFHNNHTKTEGGLRGALQNFLFTETDFYEQYYANYLQGVWIFILFGAALSGLLRKKEKTDAKRTVLFLLQLSLFGLVAFLMLFEARARYLYLYLPYFCALAAIGYCNAAQWLHAKRSRHDNQKQKSEAESHG